MQYKDIAPGADIPGISKKIDIVQTVMYCAVTWDFVRLHYDADYARSRGFKEPVVDPQMYGPFMARMLMDWASPEGRVKKLTVRYRSACFLGDTLNFKGKVSGKQSKDSENLVDCATRAENQNGECIAEGAAVLTFPRH